MAKPKTVSFDGARQCFVCETLEAEKLTFPIHPAGPAVCTKCAELTIFDLPKIKDKAQRNRAALIVGTPIALALVSTWAKKLLGAPAKKKRRG